MCIQQACNAPSTGRIPWTPGLQTAWVLVPWHSVWGIHFSVWVRVTLALPWLRGEGLGGAQSRGGNSPRFCYRTSQEGLEYGGIVSLSSVTPQTCRWIHLPHLFSACVFGDGSAGYDLEVKNLVSGSFKNLLEWACLNVMTSFSETTFWIPPGRGPPTAIWRCCYLRECRWFHKPSSP